MTDRFIAAGGITESDLFSINSTIFTYFDRGQATKMELFYPYEIDIQICLHGAQAAVLLDRRELHLVNLSDKKYWDFRCPGVDTVFWDEAGETIIVVSTDGRVVRINAEKARVEGRAKLLPNPSVPAKVHKKDTIRSSGIPSFRHAQNG